MNRRGLTLLELLIAISLVVALGAIVLPAMTGVQNQRAFDSTVQIIRDQLLLARAHAQSTASPVEVIYYSRSPRVEVRLFDPALQASASPFVDADGSDDRQQAEPLILDEQDEDELVIPEAWAYRHLAQNVRITKTPPQEAADDFDDAFGSFDDFGADFADQSQLFDPDEEPHAIRLAVFLPDGSALLGEPFWVIDNNGRVGRLEVNPWTGLPSFDATGAYRGTDEPVDDEEFDDEPEEFERDETIIEEDDEPVDTEPTTEEGENGTDEDEEPDQQ